MNTRSSIDWREVAVLALLAVAVPLAYTLYTGHVWEDYFITFRHSRNLAEGNGLVYQPGERVHGFTSPIGVLLPAAFHRLAGNPQSYEPALWCFRVVSIVAFAAGAMLLFLTVRHADPSAVFARWAVPLLYLMETKGVAYATNGQETGFVLFFLTLAIYVLQRGVVEWWLIGGLAWAGLQWTRPDGCIAIVVTGVAAMAFPNGRPRRDVVVALVKMGLLAGVLYLPWFLWTWWYYGTPIPHTVVAKQAMGWGFEKNLSLWERITKSPRWALDPICAAAGGWDPFLLRLARAAAFAGLLVWALPLKGPLGTLARKASLLYVGLAVYLDSVVGFYWYMPPAAACLLLSLGAALFVAPRMTFLMAFAMYVMLLQEHEARLRIGHHMQNTILIALAALVASRFLLHTRWVGATFSAALVAVLATISVHSAREMQVQQQVVEFGNRKRIGEWLQANVPAGQSVYLECLGYIGYFSNCRMLDYPGLAAPEVVKAHKRTGKEMIELIPELKPDWLVLRPWEYLSAIANPAVRESYSRVADFDVNATLDRDYPNLPGIEYLKVDSRFIILKKGPASNSAAAN